MKEANKSVITEKLHGLRSKILNKILKKADIADAKLTSSASMDAVDPEKAGRIADRADLEVGKSYYASKIEFTETPASVIEEETAVVEDSVKIPAPEMRISTTASFSDTPNHQSAGYEGGSNIQSLTSNQKRAALKMVKRAYETGALDEKAYNLAVSKINEGR